MTCTNTHIHCGEVMQDLSCSREPQDWLPTDQCHFLLQHCALPGRAERLDAAGDDQRGAEESVSRGRGAGLLPVTSCQVRHGCKWLAPCSFICLHSGVNTEAPLTVVCFNTTGCHLKETNKRTSEDSEKSSWSETSHQVHQILWALR